MLIDLTLSSNLRIEHTRFLGSIVVLVADNTDSYGYVKRHVGGMFYGKYEEMMPQFVYTEDTGRVYRGFSLPLDSSHNFEAMSYSSLGVVNIRKRVVTIGFQPPPTNRVTIEVSRNDPAREKGNHTLELSSDYVPNSMPPYITWSNLGK